MKVSQPFLKRMDAAIRSLLSIWLPLLFLSSSAGAQVTRLERERALIMLDVIRADVMKNYFDSTFGGLDMKAVFDSARARVQRAERPDQLLGAIALAPLELRDSHTGFVPPSLVYRAAYGWDMQFVGDTCRVTKVEPGSDAEAKGLRAGDAVLEVSGVPLSRRNLWQLKYAIHALQPRRSLVIRVKSAGSDSAARVVEIVSKVVQRQRLLDLNSSFDLGDLIREGENAWLERAPRYTVLDDRVAVWKLTGFHAYREWVDDLAKSLRGRQALVLDLRGNGGGAVSSLLRLIGVFQAQNIVVANEVGRSGLTQLVAEGAGAKRFEGEVIVLVDAESASASEIFARTLQLSSRGKVIGDRTAGFVRKSRTYTHAVGTQIATFYGISVTIADLMMPDGGLLENTGVVPDVVMLPTGQDIAAGRDPVLAHALSLVGVSRTPEQAAALMTRN